MATNHQHSHKHCVSPHQHMHMCAYPVQHTCAHVLFCSIPSKGGNTRKEAILSPATSPAHTSTLENIPTVPQQATRGHLQHCQSAATLHHPSTDSVWLSPSTQCNMCHACTGHTYVETDKGAKQPPCCVPGKAGTAHNHNTMRLVLQAAPRGAQTRDDMFCCSCHKHHRFRPTVLVQVTQDRRLANQHQPNKKVGVCTRLHHSNQHHVLTSPAALEGSSAGKAVLLQTTLAH